MSGKIELTPAELKAQANEMNALEREYTALFTGIQTELKSVNSNWSSNLSHNFEGKISSVQRKCLKLTNDLSNGAKIAETSAITFESVDSQLAKLYSTGVNGVGKNGVGTVSATSVESTVARFWEAVKEQFGQLPEDIKDVGEALAWIEKKYGKLPDWIKHGVDVLVPSSLQKAYMITSGLLQGDLTGNEIWGTVKSILSKNTKLAVITEAIDYTFEAGTQRSDEMERQIFEQISEGDILGVIFDGAEGFVDTIIGGTIDVLGDVGSGLVDKIPIIKSINKLAEYGTGLMGWNDGDGYSIGGLIDHSTEKISEGIDVATDVITDATDIVTDAITDGVKTGINWVKSWFD